MQVFWDVHGRDMPIQSTNTRRETCLSRGEKKKTLAWAGWPLSSFLLPMISVHLLFLFSRQSQGQSASGHLGDGPVILSITDNLVLPSLRLYPRSFAARLDIEGGGPTMGVAPVFLFFFD
ncbi:hypothetical protein LZ32DRAFT_194628 [Colletotrichum eremochloae]|nr:hypothetical protein LZ32DRAFT_194628 [Colletotrichum eremochloae]